MSDIGGQLGIWVGISVITLSEVVELFYLLMRHFLSSRRNFPGPSSTAARSARAQANSYSDAAWCAKNPSSASAAGGCGGDDSRNGRCGGCNASGGCGSGGSAAKDCCRVGGASCKEGRPAIDLVLTDEELGWIEYDRRYRPNEYTTYSRRSGTGNSIGDGSASGTGGGFTFEPIDRDRLTKYRSYFSES